MHLLAHRPVLQEDLTQELAALLHERMETRGSAAYVEGLHLCMAARGIERARGARGNIGGARRVSRESGDAPGVPRPRDGTADEPAVKQRAFFIAAAVTGVVCFAVSWIGSSPSYLIGLHWDTGSFLAQMATRTDRWRGAGVPWTSHLALPQIYLIACATTQLFGGSCFDAFRLLQSLCVGTAGVLFFVAAASLSRSLTLAALVAVAFVTSWGTFRFIFEMVDNLVYLPFVVGVLALCVLRRDAWRDRDSALAGALAGVATLVSLQCVI